MPIQGTRSLISAMREDPRITAIKEEQQIIAMKEQQRVLAMKEQQRINALKEEQKSNTPPLMDAPELPGAVPETDHHYKVIPRANAAAAGLPAPTGSPVFFMPKKRKERPKKRGPGRGDAMKSHRRQPRPVDPLGSGIWQDLDIDEALDNLPSPPVHRYHENRKNVADNCPSPDDSWSWGSDWSLDDNTTNSANSEKDEPVLEKKTFLVSPVEQEDGMIYADVQVTRPGTSHHVTFIDNGRVMSAGETSPKLPLRKRFVSYLRYLKWKLFN